MPDGESAPDDLSFKLGDWAENKAPTMNHFANPAGMLAIAGEWNKRRFDSMGEDRPKDAAEIYARGLVESAAYITQPFTPPTNDSIEQMIRNLGPAVKSAGPLLSDAGFSAY